MKIGPGYKFGKGFSRMPKGRFFKFLKPAWICAALLALLLSFFICKATEGFLLDATFETQRELATKINSDRKVSIFIMQSQKKQGSEVSFAPFNVTEKSGKPIGDEPQKALDAFTLVGTLPHIGAWLNDGGGTALILRDQEYNGYKLELIDTGKVLFTKDGENFPLYLELGGKSKPKESQTAQPQPTPRGETPGDSGIVKASLGNPGSIKREIIDKLLMDPYRELAKIKLAPEGSGMKLMYAAGDSLFAQLGMQEGDTLVSINDVSLKDMANVSNAIASLLNSNQFNLGLVRDSNQMQLDYAVK